MARLPDMAFRVALTFDAEHPDRPTTPGVQERLLDILDREAVRATFFVQGRWAEAYPATGARIATAGHLIGSHSHYHAEMPHLSDEGLRFDIETARDRVAQATGVDPLPYFRCPFGVGFDDPRVLGALDAQGFRNYMWDVEALDWDHARTAAQVAEDIVTPTLAHGDGCVVLLHTWPDRTEGALPGIVARLRDAGAVFVRLDELE